MEFEMKGKRSENLTGDFRGRMTTSGTLKAGFDVRNIPADNFLRGFLPPLATGYVRKVAHYVLSPDGTQLDFEFVDEELGPPATAPQPAISVVVQ